MAGLVGYDSSDDERDETKQPLGQDVEAQPPRSSPASAEPETEAKPAEQHPGPPPPSEAEPFPVIAPVSQSAVPLGPSLPPPMEEATMAGDWYQAEGSSSPYSANRALIHDLTLPSIPNLDIPPSPPGSPPPRASKSFEQFLALKKKGTHFNSKLEQSTALRNPGVTDKLMDFVGLDERQQYETTLSPDLWNPAAFPETAFLEKLRKSRDRIAKQREADKASGARTFVDFVPSTAAGDATATAAGGLSRGDKSRSSWK